MHQLQFKVLYRQFLFRVFDLEMLSVGAQGDTHKLLGQFAALLIFISVTLTLPAMALSAPSPSDPQLGLVFLMIAQHFLIATSMLVVGLFAVLSWDATFPDRRDAMVLAPLPVMNRTIFLAKVAAVATSLALTVTLLHSILGLLCPLVFAARAAPAILPALSLSGTPVPVGAPELQPVLNQDLRQALTTGDLAPGTGAGLAVGVWKHGERRIFTYGAAKPDSLFEIGSISKTFTSLLLARMAEERKVRLNEPVRELLLAGTAAKSTDEEITLLDLATHHSGLPRMPDNFRPADRSNPYADYGTKQLHEYIARRGLAKPAEVSFVYSNLGAGLLGQALAVRAGRPYADLLRSEITAPLGMTDTGIKLSTGQQRRFLQGYDNKHRPVHAWDLDALAGAGAIRSTAGDLLTYLQANLHPETHPTLAKAFEISHRLRARAEGGAQIALAWFYFSDSGVYEHNGATAGYTSYVFFDPRADCAAVVLTNSGPNTLLDPSLIGQHIRQRLTGEPAISLDTVLVPAPRGFLSVLRSFVAYWFTMVAAGVFVFGAVLGTQGLAAQLLSRRLFLQVSGILQLTLIALFLSLYFLQPGFGGLDDLTIGSMGRIVQWLPSYCFLALYQQLNGTMHPALGPMALRAWMGLAFVACLTVVVYTLSYWQTLRKIMEEPDISPGLGMSAWLPRFGNQKQTAIGQFTVRTLARSRQHRLIVGFYLGIGLAFTSLLMKGAGMEINNPWQERSTLLWASSIIMIVLAAVGTRVAFAIPFDLRANSIFKLIGAQGGSETLAASRRALILLSIAPAWLATAVASLIVWPGWQTAGHLAALALLGITVSDFCLMRFRKIPFTCSWLPGKSRVNMVFLFAIGLFWAGSGVTLAERQALRRPGTTLLMLVLLVVVWACVRWTAMLQARRGEQELRFEELPEPEIQELGLYIDGLASRVPYRKRESGRVDRFLEPR
jgi:CubicO group peptidase (beta-lactamase class C family)